MTAPLDEKALDAALAAWFANTAQGWHAAMEAAVRAYLAASPSPSEMEVVAWLDETADAAPGAKGVTTDAYTAAYWEHTSGAPMTELVRASDAQSALVAMRAERDRWEQRFFKMDGNFDRAVARAEAAEAQVLRLTEENEALVAWFDGLTPNEMHEAIKKDKARIKALEEALREISKDEVHTAFGAKPARGAEVARTTLQKEQADE